MKKYTRGEHPALYAVIKTEVLSDDGDLSDGSLTDPTGSIKIIIWDSFHKVVQTSTDMTKSSTGKYVYNGYAIPATAVCSDRKAWGYEIHAVDGSSRKKIKRGYFLVVEQIV